MQDLMLRGLSGISGRAKHIPGKMLEATVKNKSEGNSVRVQCPGWKEWGGWCLFLRVWLLEEDVVSTFLNVIIMEVIKEWLGKRGVLRLCSILQEANRDVETDCWGYVGFGEHESGIIFVDISIFLTLYTTQYTCQITQHPHVVANRSGRAVCEWYVDLPPPEITDALVLPSLLILISNPHMQIPLTLFFSHHPSTSVCVQHKAAIIRSTDFGDTWGLEVWKPDRTFERWKTYSWQLVCGNV